jgi:hypothetical protein
MQLPHMATDVRTAPIASLVTTRERAKPRNPTEADANELVDACMRVHHPGMDGCPHSSSLTLSAIDHCPSAAAAAAVPTGDSL